MKEKWPLIWRLLMLLWTVSTLSAILLIALRWMTTVKYQLVSEDLRLWEVILPLFIAVSAIALYIFPKIKPSYNAIYKYEKDTLIKNGFMLYWFLGVFFMFLTLSGTQKYFSQSYGNLLVLNSLEEINDHPLAKFFKIDSLSHSPYYGTFLEKENRTYGRNPKLRMNYYVANPLFEKKEKLAKLSPLFLGLKGSKSVSLRKLRKDNSIERVFFNEMYDQLESYHLDTVQYYYRVPYSSLLNNYRTAIESRYGSSLARKAIILEPRNHPFANRPNNGLHVLYFMLGLSVFITFLLSIQKK